MTTSTSERTKALTVTALNRLVKAGLEREFGDVWVQGEISNPHTAPSGHVYFTLKDSGVTSSVFKTINREFP